MTVATPCKGSRNRWRASPGLRRASPGVRCAPGLRATRGQSWSESSSAGRAESGHRRANRRVRSGLSAQASRSPSLSPLSNSASRRRCSGVKLATKPARGSPCGSFSFSVQRAVQRASSLAVNTLSSKGLEWSHVGFPSWTSGVRIPSPALSDSFQKSVNASKARPCAGCVARIGAIDDFAQDRAEASNSNRPSTGEPE
jgi:hypothetical protein